MAKDTYYFTHDYNARSDKELVKVRMKLGIAGIGIYWCIVEMLYEENGYLMRTECERIAFELQTDESSIRYIVENLHLFQFDEDRFWSNSVLARLSKRREKSVKASNSALKKWENAKSMRSHTEGNAIKERKGEEIKGKGDSIEYSLTYSEKNGKSNQQFKNDNAQGAEIFANKIHGFGIGKNKH